ncbi:MAG: hypothetical protein ACRD0U_16285, partial [Acidimicrobiales bacterium]
MTETRNAVGKPGDAVEAWDRAVDGGWTPPAAVERLLERMFEECPDDETSKNLIDAFADGTQVAKALQSQFTHGVQELAGGTLGDVGVNAINEDQG